jgi:hypothetical protein
MLDKKKKRRSLTEEQRKRIMDTPGVIVHRNENSPGDPNFVPRYRVDLPVRASELIDAEDESEYGAAE